jgi:DNA-damage-inducible protein J
MTTLNIRIEEDTKIAAAKALADIGLDISSGVKLFLNQVIIEQGLPFMPTKNPAVLRAKWDASVADALKGKRYASGKDALKDL